MYTSYHKKSLLNCAPQWSLTQHSHERKQPGPFGEVMHVSGRSWEPAAARDGMYMNIKVHVQAERAEICHRIALQTRTNEIGSPGVLHMSIARRLRLGYMYTFTRYMLLPSCVPARCTWSTWRVVCCSLSVCLRFRPCGSTASFHETT